MHCFKQILVRTTIATRPSERLSYSLLSVVCPSDTPSGVFLPCWLAAVKSTLRVSSIQPPPPFCNGDLLVHGTGQDHANANTSAPPCTSPHCLASRDGPGRSARRYFMLGVILFLLESLSICRIFAQGCDDVGEYDQVGDESC